MRVVVAGIAQGIAFLPHTVGMSLTELDRALQRAQAISLDDAYRSAFGVSIAHRRVHQETGDVAGRRGRHRPGEPALARVNRAFHRLLVSQGMSHETAHKYVIVGNDTHAAIRGPLLLAIVLRHTRTEPFRARSAQMNSVGTFRADQRAWFAPYERDVDGQPVDEVMDWAPIESTLLQRDKVVAMLLVLAAEAVKFDKRAPAYWHAERRWLAGETAAVMQQSEDKVKRALAS